MVYIHALPESNVPMLGMEPQPAARDEQETEEAIDKAKPDNWQDKEKKGVFLASDLLSSLSQRNSK